MFKGEDIKRKRKELKMSAKELAALIKVDEGNIYKWEKGHKPHDPEDFLKVQDWLSGKTENGTVSKNSPVVSNKAQHAPNSQNLEKDLIQEVTRLMGDNLTVRATLKVIISELVPLISKATGRSHASVSAQMEKDISAEISNLKLLDKK